MIGVSVSVPRETGLLAWLRRQVARDAAAAARAAALAVRAWAESRVRSRLTASETYAQLTGGGPLAAELGVGPAQRPLVDRCVEHLAAGVRADPLPPAGNVLGGVRLTLLVGGVGDLLAEPFARYLSAGKRGATTVPWLEWLLAGGGAVLLSDYRIQYVRPGRAPGSRTGAAVMVGGGGWSLFRGGRPGANWVEDALRDVSREAVPEIEAAVRRHLR